LQGIYPTVAKRRKQNSAKKILITIIALPALALAAYYGISFFNKPKFVRYPGFGIDMPVNYAIHGIDVSRHQSLIDWQDVKDMQIKNIKIGFGFIKATEGVGNVDDQFEKNWLAAKRAAIPRGAYHFFVPSKSGKEQARNFIETVRLDKGDLPPVLDVEQVNRTSVTKLQQGISDWLVMVEAYYHVKPIIYTNAFFYTNFLGKKFDDYPLWVAHYLVKDKPHISRNWVFWQHNETGQVNGIDAYVDFNVFNGDSTAFKELLIK
jgi:lysozyme